MKQLLYGWPPRTSKFHEVTFVLWPLEHVSSARICSLSPCYATISGDCSFKHSLQTHLYTIVRKWTGALCVLHFISSQQKMRKSSLFQSHSVITTSNASFQEMSGG